MTNKRNAGWQRWLFAALVIGFLWVLAQRFAEIEQLVGTLIQGNWGWISLAIGLEILYYLAFAALFKSAFDITDVTTEYRDLIPLSFAFLFANTTTASGGTAGLALFVDDVRRRGGSAAKATASTLLAHTANYGMFALLLALGLFFLFLQNDLTGLEVISALILFVLVLVLCSVLLLGLRWPNALRRLLAAIQRLVLRVGGWMKRPSLLPGNWADKNANDFIAASQAIATHPTRLGRLLLVALLTHVIHLLLLLTLFFAFGLTLGQTITPGILLAGYTLSILFTIVSPTPNGIGVVEAIVPLMYSSLDVNSDSAVAITFAFRGITFWIPMVIGFVLLRQLPMFGGSGRSLAESGQVRLLAMLTALMGLLNVITAVQPNWLAPIAILTRLSPVAVQQGSRITAVISGFILLVLAQGLWRHKRVAWMLTILVLLISVASHVLRSDVTAAVLGLLLVLFLFSQRSHFVARSDPPSVWQGVQVLLAAFGFTLAYGTIGTYLLDRYYGQPFDFVQAWRQIFLLFSTLVEPNLRPASAYDIFADSIYIVGLGTLVYALFQLLRPVLTPPPASERERQRAARMVAEYGRSPLSALVPLPDRSYFFSDGGSVIAYLHRRRAAIALGEPVGPMADQTAAIAEFQTYCRQHDWAAAFYQLSPAAQARYEAAGLELLCVGHEAVIDLSTFQPPQSALPEGQVQLLAAPFSEALVEQMRLVSDEWLAFTGTRERPFTADRFGRAYVQQAHMAVLRDQTQAIVAVAALFASPDKEALLLGFLRHRQGVHDTALRGMLIEITQWGQKAGYGRFHLGLSPLSIETTPTDLLNRLWRRLFYRADQHDALQEVKESLQPTWEPRYLAFTSPTNLPTISSALARSLDLP